jgi:uncharacterized protein YlxW (UPF0749 family)
MVADQRTHSPASDTPQAVMGLLNYVTATSLDEDYAHVSQRREATAPGGPRKPGRPGLTALVVLVVFGVLVATAAVQTSRNADESADSRTSLGNQVNSRRETLDTLRARAARLDREVTALQASNLDATARGRGVQTRLDRLGLLSGAVATTGEGIKVRVADAPNTTDDKQRVHALDLQRLVNGLWEVGAESISINGQRLTSLSAIRDAGSSIGVNFVYLRSPYTVLAIGDSKTMGGRLLDTKGGQTMVTLQSSFGLEFAVTTEESMTLPEAKRTTLRYARIPSTLSKAPGGTE